MIVPSVMILKTSARMNLMKPLTTTMTSACTKTRYGFGVPLEGYGLGYKDNYDYGNDIDSDDNTYEYNEVANGCDEYGFDGDGHGSSKDGNRHVYCENSGCNDHKILGGHNVLHSLSNATSLELLADSGEVILNRELKRCPSFSNLKILSLGEWCTAGDFDALVFLLQHLANLERLFLELKLNNIRKPMESGVKPKGRSFACKNLRMVKIKCSKDDVRVHKLAHLFRANGVPVEKIFVRRTGSTREQGFKNQSKPVENCSFRRNRVGLVLYLSGFSNLCIVAILIFARFHWFSIRFCSFWKLLL